MSPAFIRGFWHGFSALFDLFSRRWKLKKEFDLIRAEEEAQKSVDRAWADVGKAWSDVGRTLDGVMKQEGGFDVDEDWK